MQIRRFAALAILGLAISPCLADSARESRTVTKGEAEALIRAALPAKLKRLPKFGVEISQDSNFPRFYSALVYGEGEPNGSVMVGTYDVDRETGDVWNAVICEHLTSSSLVKLQVAIRNRIGLTKDEYQKTRRQGPMCESGMPRLGPGK